MGASPGADRLVVLDRDGVINRDSPEFVKSLDEWRPLPGSIEAIAALSKAGFTVAVASNQSGLARGLLDRKALRAMHRKLRRLVASEGGRVDRIVVCPHGPDDGCRCRKPAPGLLERLATANPDDGTIRLRLAIALFETGQVKKAIELGMITLRRSGICKLKEGITTIEEVVKETVL